MDDGWAFALCMGQGFIEGLDQIVAKSIYLLSFRVALKERKRKAINE